MKRLVIILLTASACLGAGWGAYRAMATPEPALSRYMPAGSLLYLEAKDFASLLADWNKSSEKRMWLKSDSYEVFSRSRLLLRLNDASTEFSKAAGLPVDGKMLNQLAGAQSAVAIFDIGKLQFLYITRLPSANSMQSNLWQTRSKFETRSAGGVTFYVRRDPKSGREVAFAVTGDYLLLATREDLMAGALQLIAGGKDNSIETESWWSQSVAATGAAGELRMVLNLEKIVPSPYFRSYWIQQNISEMKQYSAGICDLVRTGNEYREERVLLKRVAAPGDPPQDRKGTAAVAEILRLVPSETSLYEAKASPSAADTFTILETKILAPHMGPLVPDKYAPQVELGSGETGTSSDLETRIDQPPVRQAAAVDASAALRSIFEKNPVAAILGVQSSEQGKQGIFVRLHSGMALLGESNWDESAVRAALVDCLQPSITTSQLGVNWRTKEGYGELDGLWTLAVAVRGKYLVISDHPALLAAMLVNLDKKSDANPAIYVAGFNHVLEREKFTNLAGLLKQPGATQSEETIDFFSGNISSLSATLANLTSETIVIRDAGNKVLQAATYEWSH